MSSNSVAETLRSCVHGRCQSTSETRSSSSMSLIPIWLLGWFPVPRASTQANINFIIRVLIAYLCNVRNLPSKMVWNIYDYSLKAKMSSVIEERVPDKPCCLVMKCALPPASWNPFRQDHCRELPVVMLSISLV